MSRNSLQHGHTAEHGDPHGDPHRDLPHERHVDPRSAIAVAAHLTVLGAALAMAWAAAANLSLPAKIGVAAVIAAVMLPGLRWLISGDRERHARLGLLLVLVIGIGVVEVLATGAALPASVLLGAALLEFALLFSLSRNRNRRAPHAPGQR